MSAPLLAFLATTDEYEAEILFTPSLAAARKYADGASVRRASEFDQFAAAGKVPAQVLLEEHGWRFECAHHGCSAKLDADREVWDDDAQDLRRDIELVFVDAQVFCCPACVEKEAARLEKLKRIADELRAGVVARYPGVVPGMAAVHNEPPYIEFTFPGGKGAGHWELGADTVLLCQIDVEAWHAFRAA